MFCPPSRRIATICSSLNRLLRIGSSLSKSSLSQKQMVAIRDSGRPEKRCQPTTCSSRDVNDFARGSANKEKTSSTKYSQVSKSISQFYETAPLSRRVSFFGDMRPDV